MASIIVENASEFKPWIYEFEQVLANLNEPGATRLISVIPVIELAAEMDQIEGKIFLESKCIL